MNLRVNDNKLERIQSRTVNGMLINIFLEAAAVNTDVPVTGYQTLVGFDPSQINIQVDLKRNNNTYPILNTNLALLAIDATKLKGGHLWFEGLPVQVKAADKTGISKRSVFIDFQGHYNLKDEDELIINATVNRGAFGSAVNPNTATVQIEASDSIGIETAIHRFNLHSITAELNQDRVNLGDNVTSILMHSFESDWKKAVFRQVSLSSDRLDWTANELQLDTRHWMQFPAEIADYLFASTPVANNPLRFPNSFFIHSKEEIDKGQLSFTMNPANVLATSNYVMYWTFETSMEILTNAAAMQKKHADKDIAKVGLTV